MASTYSNLKIQLMTTGENTTTWGNVTNVNLGTALEEAITGSADAAFSSADVTLTLTDTNATQSARNLRLNLTGTATAGFNLILGSGCQIEKAYIINNATDGTITVKNTTGTGIAVPTGKTMWVYNNGTNVVDVVTHLTSLTASGVITGSAGFSSAAGFGFTINGDCGLTRSAASSMSLGNGTNNDSSATLSLTKVSFNNANFTSPSTGLMQLGTGTTTGTAGSLSLTGITASGAVSAGSLTLTTALSVANGGTGQTTYTNGQLLIGNTTGSTLTKATLTAGTGISITNGTGTISIAATGTVSSVGGTGSVNGLTLTGTVTSSGDLTLGGSITSVASGATIDSIVIGYRNIPRSTTATTAAVGDVGKCIAVTAGLTIPNATFAAGDAVSIYNDSGSAVTITQGTSLTLRQAGTASTGNRTLAARGMATVWFNSASEAIISGAGIS